jgi:hypothetical protein
MNINEIKNKLNDVICELVEEIVKRELKHEKIDEIKEGLKPELEPGDICEAWSYYDRDPTPTICYYSGTRSSGEKIFVSHKNEIGEDHGVIFENYKLRIRANPKNKIVIARDKNKNLSLFYNYDVLFIEDGTWCIRRGNGSALNKKAFPQIKPGEKIEIEF